MMLTTDIGQRFVNNVINYRHVLGSNLLMNCNRVWLRELPSGEDKLDKDYLLDAWAEIHQALLSQFSLLVELFIGKLAVKD